jgi:hypothetical protein
MRMVDVPYRITAFLVGDVRILGLLQLTGLFLAEVVNSKAMTVQIH